MFFSFDIYNILSTLVISFGIQMFFFAFAATFKTDKLTDFTYSLSFIIITLLLVIFNKAYTVPHLILSSFIVLWGLRLGSYLFLRIIRIGEDKRFDDKRGNVVRFFLFWILQAITVWAVMIPASVFLSTALSPQITTLFGIGAALWIFGFIFELISDAQKYSFKNNNDNKGKWIQSGLWRISRHPNYFGESVLWWGIFLMAYSSLPLGNWWIVTGPVFITLLLLFVSGIPLLEKSADARYGDNKDYQEYKRKTSIFIPWFVKK